MQVALGQFQASRTAGRLRGMMTALSDPVLTDLLSKLSAANMPAELLRMLKAMQTDGRAMPNMQPESSGRSFLTTWLGSRHFSAVASGFEGTPCNLLCQHVQPTSTSCLQKCCLICNMDCNLVGVIFASSLGFCKHAIHCCLVLSCCLKSPVISCACVHAAQHSEALNCSYLATCYLCDSMLHLAQFMRLQNPLYTGFEIPLHDHNLFVHSSKSLPPRCPTCDLFCMAECSRRSVFAGVKTQPEPTSDVTEIGGVKIFEGKYAMSEEGKILSPSSQTMPQLKAELAARNLSTEGKSKELKRRVMVRFPQNCRHLHFI